MKTKLLLLAGSLLLLLMMSCYPYRKINMNYSANQLSDGYLLVRLQDGQKQADALRASGYPKKAEKVLKHIEEKNEQIIATIQQYYSFSPAYFFYGRNTQEVLTGTWAPGMVFDEQQQPVEWPRLEGKSFMVAEMGTGYADWLPPEGESEKIQSGSGTNAFDALVLYDNELQPYRQIYYSDGHYTPAVERLDEELEKYMQRPLSLYNLND